MKKFIFKTILASILLAAITIRIFTIAPMHPDDYLQAYNKKYELVKNTPSPRMIFIGGSNIAYAIDSSKIKDSLGINIVNYGLAVGIGLKFLIDDIEPLIKDNDIIVFIPEYHHFFIGGTAYGSPETIAPLLQITGWSKLNLLNIKQLTNVCIGIPEIIKHAFPPKGIFKCSSYNQYGDMIKHWNMESSTKPTRTKNEYSIDWNFTDYFLKKIEDIGAKSKVIIMPPVCVQTAFQNWEKPINELSNYFSKKGYPFLVSPQEHALPDRYIFDSDYHINYQGVQMFTEKIIKELKMELNLNC